MPLGVTLIISGTHFVTTVDTLKSKANTRLANVDYPGHPNNRREYRYDRNAESFGYILDYYRTGELHMPSNACGIAFKKEMDFWGIDASHMSPCCMHRLNGGHFSKYEQYLETTKKFSGLERVAGDDCAHKTFRLFENPYSSAIAAKIPAVLHFLATVVVIASVVVNVTRTSMAWMHQRTYENRTLPEGFYPNELRTYVDDGMVILQILHIVSACYILVDYFIRFISCPFSKKEFLLEPFNILDLVLIPFLVIGVVVSFLALRSQGYVVLVFISVGQLLLVFRLFKHFRHCQGVKVLYLTFKASISELFVYFFVYTFVCLFFACVVLLCEFKDPAEDFHTGFFSLFNGMFWSLVTLTTIGYGDMVPKTPFGKACTGVCAFTGFLLLAWVVAIVGSNFSTFLKYARRVSSRKLILVSVMVNGDDKAGEEMALLSSNVENEEREEKAAEECN